MEPKLLSLARELFRAASHHAIGVDVATGRDFDAMAVEHRRSWVRAALALRPDLGEGLSFPPGHWLHEVLPGPDAAAPRFRVEASWAEPRHVSRLLEATDRAHAARQLFDAGKLVGISLEDILVVDPDGNAHEVIGWCEVCDGPIWDSDPDESWHHDPEDPIVLHTACAEEAAGG